MQLHGIVFLLASNCACGCLLFQGLYLWGSAPGSRLAVW